MPWSVLLFIWFSLLAQYKLWACVHSGWPSLLGPSSGISRSLVVADFRLCRREFAIFLTPATGLATMLGPAANVRSRVHSILKSQRGVLDSILRFLLNCARDLSTIDIGTNPKIRHQRRLVKGIQVNRLGVSRVTVSAIKGDSC